MIVNDSLDSRSLAIGGRNAVFLDRDGTLIVERGYLGDPSRAELEAEAVEALCRLRDAGWALVVISNQSGVARGYFSEKEMWAVDNALRRLLDEHGIVLDGVYYCTHAPGEGCECRKPAPGLLLQAAQELGLDLAKSVMLGDKKSDVQAAVNAGVAACLVTTGHGIRDSEWAHSEGHHVAADLLEAAMLILDGHLPIRLQTA